MEQRYSGTSPAQSRLPEEEQESMYRLLSGLLLRAIAENDQPTAEFYLGAGESGGLSRQEIVRRALEAEPNNPLLLSLASSPQ